MPKKAKKKTLDLTLPIFQLKISLRHVAPTIWRRVQMDDCSLDELHDIIQIAMGWQDEHMFAFVIDDEQYGDLERGGDFDHDSRSVQLSDLAEQGHTRFRYDYDFGDEWQHVIEIEKTLPAEEMGYYPRCVKGERACPPEDCGGPYEYPYFLEKLQDPKHGEHVVADNGRLRRHEEALEWVGDDFDPEEFDVEKVNDELRYLRRFLGHGKGQHSQSAFIEGDLVQVNPGIVHDQFPDIPLGGWVGNVSRVIWLTPICYEVNWTESTLQQAHLVYHKRCQRDGIAPETYWLEADQLSEATLESPVAMEQPTNIITRPLSMDDHDDRIRMVFGLTSDDALPKDDEKTQQQFLDYLKNHLSFPFKADYLPSTSIGPSESGVVTVLGFAETPLNREVGIVCEARSGKDEFQVPLAGLQVNEDDPNAKFVEDYTDWLWDAEEFVLDVGDDFDEKDDTDEETIGNVPLIPEELLEMVKAQRQKFIEKFGRNPGPGDKLFFDLPPLEHVEHQIAQAMKKVGVDPAIIHAFEKTGLIVTEANQHLLKGADLEEWNAAIDEFNAKAEPPQFPIGTVAYYGPDDKTTTKIVAGVIKEEGADAIIKRWVATDVMTNPKVRKEIDRFFKKYGVKQVAMTDGNLGCPHEEGEDFPDGGDCPFCPWWKGKQGSGAKE
jgi:hypothetical protein